MIIGSLQIWICVVLWVILFIIMFISNYNELTRQAKRDKELE